VAPLFSGNHADSAVWKNCLLFHRPQSLLFIYVFIFVLQHSLIFSHLSRQTWREEWLGGGMGVYERYRWRCSRGKPGMLGKWLFRLGFPSLTLPVFWVWLGGVGVFFHGGDIFAASVACECIQRPWIFISAGIGLFPEDHSRVCAYIFNIL